MRAGGPSPPTPMLSIGAPTSLSKKFWYSVEEEEGEKRNKKKREERREEEEENKLPLVQTLAPPLLCCYISKVDRHAVLVVLDTCTIYFFSSRNRTSIC